ncbi:HMG domain-containing protein 4-like isoform X2 [Takifugu flavidus]|uniref:HMG domain-containing protein 4-like isoform X2 n=1 Tax=Takifugu flavidus TaxID=433684 RepID=UPI0025442467|nr:HMG domain-containing protein 4-like isoform X2 [Takifugu flavidus]
MDHGGQAGGQKVGPREGRSSYRGFLLDEKELQELESEFEDFSSDDHNETSPSSMSGYWGGRERSNTAEDVGHPDAPVPDSFCSSFPAPKPTAPLVGYTCGPIASANDAFTPPFGTTCTSEWNPVSVAAHLHLLGEALSLIGLHLKGTKKWVSVSNSVSLLLDSLLCALAPLTVLTAEIPELGRCTQHSLASTLENIAYLMPGM